MKYIKKFYTKSEKAKYITEDAVYPNVCLDEAGIIEYNSSLSPLYIEAIEDLTVKFSNNAIKYSFDKYTWVDLPANTATPTISAGKRVYFKANITTASQSSGIGRFTISARCNVGGAPASLLFGDSENFEEELFDYCFITLFQNTPIIDASWIVMPKTTAYRFAQYMFYNCRQMVTAPYSLVATKLVGSHCYKWMFENCVALVNAPKLPATTLTTSCYELMFSKCALLEVAPDLPAEELSSDCYKEMFKNCTALSYIKAMFTTTPSSSYTSNWVSGVAATGTFVKNAAATWDVTGADGVPSGWTVETATE